MSMETRMLPISKVFPNIGQVKGLPKNPRFIRDEKYKKLVQSIKDDPEMLELREVIVYDTDDPSLGYVVAGGNMRYRAMKELGYKEVPCKVLHTGFPIEKLRRIVLKDNSSFGETDFQLLIDEWSMDEIELAAIDIPEIGEAVEDEVAKGAEGAEGSLVAPGPSPMEESTVKEDDDFEQNDIETDDVIKEGQLWKLGRHLLLCGDSTRHEDVQRLFPNGEKCQLYLTDSPYGVNYGFDGSLRAEKGDGLLVLNDNLSGDGFLDFLVKAFGEAKQILQPGGTYYLFHSDSHSYYFRLALITIGEMTLRQTLIWNKNSLVLGRQDYHWKHEPILTGWREGAAHNWYSDRKQSTVIDWDRPTKSVEHPTMKPVGLIGYLMKNSSKKGDIVYDGFGGSGTTLIAAEQLGRTCRMIELSPHYVSVIIARYIKLKKNYADVYLVEQDGTQKSIMDVYDKETLDSWAE